MLMDSRVRGGDQGHPTGTGLPPEVSLSASRRQDTPPAHQPLSAWPVPSDGLSPRDVLSSKGTGTGSEVLIKISAKQGGKQQTGHFCSEPHWDGSRAPWALGPREHDTAHMHNHGVPSSQDGPSELRGFPAKRRPEEVPSRALGLWMVL